jgi:photosystem II stability/assembly factor-like uncharacterized protein
MQGGGRTLSLKIVRDDPLILMRTDWWGVWRSDDGGLTWKEQIKGAANSSGSDIAITAAGTIYAATMDNGLLSSNDGGATYKPLFPSRGYDKAKNGHVWRLAVTGKDNATVIATSSPWAESVNQVIISRDGGNTFALAREGLPEKRPVVHTLWGQGYPRAFAVDPYEPSRVYLGIDGDDGGGLFISDDGGSSWRRSKAQPPCVRIYNALAVDPTETTRIIWGACGQMGGVYLSRDAGGDWEHVLSETGCIFDAAIAKDGVMYAGGDQQGPVLYASHDNGTHWKLLKRFPGVGTCEAITPDPSHPQRVALSTVAWSGRSGGRIYITDDGEYWRDITGDLPEGSGAAAMAFGPGGWLYIMRYAGSVYRTQLD